MNFKMYQGGDKKINKRFKYLLNAQNRQKFLQDGTKFLQDETLVISVTLLKIINLELNLPYFQQN